MAEPSAMQSVGDDLKKWSSQIRKGSLEMCVLGAIAARPSYGFEIAQVLGGAGELGIGEGTLYPLLNRLQSEALIEASWRESASGPPRKYYALTEPGRETFARMAVEWRRYALAVERILSGEGLTAEPSGVPDAPVLEVAPRLER